MAEALKPNKKHRHIYAIIRYESNADEKTPIEHRVTVKKVVNGLRYAEQEVKRLNDLNSDKSSCYFCQITAIGRGSCRNRGIGTDATDRGRGSSCMTIPR